MKLLWIYAIAWCIALGGCAADLGKDARFGMYGGKPRESKPEPAFDVQSTHWDARWFPAHVRWAPDDSHLLVSLCHVNRSDYCRIGKYWIAEKRWEILNLQPRITYRWPSYSPDGKTIVASVIGCDENYRCVTPFALALLSPDGQRMTRLLATRAVHPSFSDDGKRIIYWRHTGGGGADVAMFELATAKEQLLTQLLFFASETVGPAFFLPGGDRFLFAGWLRPGWSGDPLKKDGQIVLKNGKFVFPSDPRYETKFDPSGPLHGMIRYVADLREGPVTKKNFTRMALLWPDGFSGIGAGAVDISRTGEVLYFCGRGCYMAKKVADQYTANAVTIDTKYPSRNELLMLRPAAEDSHDTAAFLLPNGGQLAAVSNDSRRVAFLENGEGFWHFKDRFGIVSLNAAAPIFIDWPRLELDPAATQLLYSLNKTALLGSALH